MANKLADMLLAMLSILMLSWTWGIFHPAIMIALLAIIFLAGAKSTKKAAIAVAVAALLFAPSVKNQIAFGFFGTSSWVGLNISQVAPKPGEGCSFKDFRKTLPQIAHPGTLFNHPSIIPYAARCGDSAVDSIRTDLPSYVASRAKRFIASTRYTSADYFFPPKGFENYPRISGDNPIFLADGSPNYGGILLSAVVLGSNLVLFGIVLAAPFIVQRRFRYTALMSAIFLLTIVGIGHAANGSEQERMRYSIDAVLYFALIAATYGLVVKYLPRRRLPD